MKEQEDTFDKKESYLEIPANEIYIYCNIIYDIYSKLALKTQERRQ